jgi:hypothetical protein
MGSQCDIDKKNMIMVNIEELSEEDQRKYTELQEYIKQQFLSGAKKDRSGKVTLNQDFELPAIKLNKDKVEVLPTVSQASPPNLVTQYPILLIDSNVRLVIRVVWLLVSLLALKK